MKQITLICSEILSRVGAGQLRLPGAHQSLLHVQPPGISVGDLTAPLTPPGRVPSHRLPAPPQAPLLGVNYDNVSTIVNETLFLNRNAISRPAQVRRHIHRQIKFWPPTHAVPSAQPLYHHHRNHLASACRLHRHRHCTHHALVTACEMLNNRHLQLPFPSPRVSSNVTLPQQYVHQRPPTGQPRFF